MNQLEDRCDECGAQAFVKVINPKDHTLEFCAHHYAKHEQVLFVQGFIIDEDIRENINAKPSISANAK